MLGISETLLWSLLLSKQFVSGIRYIYIDLGTNDGTSIQSFVQGIHGDVAADGSQELEGGWKRLLEGCDCQNKNILWHVIAVEANPLYTDQIQTLRADLLKKGAVRSMSLYTGVAISTYNGYIDLILDGIGDSPGDAGSSTMKESKSAVGRHVQVEALDILTLFKRERITQRDFVVVKVDIEGGEYAVVRKILLFNLWQYIDRLAVEWHHNAFLVFGHPGDDDIRKKQSNYQELLDNHLKYTKQYESLMWMVEGLNKNWTIHNWG